MVGKIAIITGAGRGIGKALAIGLSRDGFKVVITGRNEKDLNNVAKRLKGDYLIKECDISKWEDCQSLVKETVKKFGTIDVLINNASGWVEKSLLDSSKEELEELLDTTIRGTSFITKLCFEQMVKKRSGHVFSLLTSTYRHGFGFHSKGSVLTPYYTAKFGVSGLTESLKREAVRYGIKVTSVYLGSIASDLDIDDSEDKLLKTHESERVHVKSVVDSILFILKQPKNTIIDEIVISPPGDLI